MTKKHLILFSAGKDRPGIADEIATVLYEGGANLEDSRMVVLGGTFSGMTLFSCRSEQRGEIERGLEDLKRRGLCTYLYEAEEPTAASPPQGLPLRLEVKAMDHPGIVQKVVHLLHEHRVNIETLDTQVSQAPLSGTPLFTLSLGATVPAGKPIAQVKEDLLQLARDADLDLMFRS